MSVMWEVANESMYQGYVRKIVSRTISSAEQTVTRGKLMNRPHLF